MVLHDLKVRLVYQDKRVTSLSPDIRVAQSVSSFIDTIPKILTDKVATRVT